MLRRVLFVLLSAVAASLLATTPSWASLPDGRAYELVSTSGNTGEPYAPPTGILEEHFELLTGEHPFEASDTGESITYVGEPPLTGGSGEIGASQGIQWLARRTSDGWNTTAITPGSPDLEGLERTPYEAFSPDLTSQIILGGERSPLDVDVPVGCRSLYAHDADSGAYRALFSSTEAPNKALGCGHPLFAGQAEGLTKVVFQSEAALTANAHEATEAPPTRIHNEIGGQYGEPCMFGCNLYEAVAGHVQLVSVLPNGEVVDSATFGGYPGPKAQGPLAETAITLTNFSNVISADGTKIFWTDTQLGANFEHVYVTENGTSTVQVSGPGAAEYWTATPDGHYAYYTEAGGLWQFDTLTNTRDELTPAGADVEGVIGGNQTGADGDYLYFVAEGALAPGATPKVCQLNVLQAERARIEHEEGLITEEQLEAILQRLEREAAEEHSGGTPPQTGCNLYMRHEGHTTFVAALSPDDNRIVAGGSNRLAGDWKANLGERTAEVTPDGQHLVFESVRPLTGYNDVVAGKLTQQAFVYSAGEGQLSCVSCSPTGASPSVPIEPANQGELPVSLQSNTYMHHWISDDGSRVFFDSEQPLSTQDENEVQDVYEWEREGASSCPTATSLYGGCIFLLSGASTRGYSFLVDADAAGDNVFLEHQGPLGAVDVPPDRNQLYDARVGGGFPSTSACVGCQSVLPAVQGFAAPASSGFSGTGNYPPPSAKPAQTARPLTNAQKLANAISVCRKKRSKHKRTACERNARTRYASTHRAKKTTKGHHQHRGTRA